MDLKDFIAETLTQIMEGVKEAQNNESTHGGEVNPEVDSGGYRDGAEEELKRKGFMVSVGKKAIDFVNFDVAITVNEGKGTKGGIGILVAGLGVGSQGQSTSSSGSQNKIQFKIPISLPRKT